MRITLDVENTVIKRNGKLHLDPFEETNRLVMVGILTEHGEQTLVTLEHKTAAPTHNGPALIQDILDHTTLMVGHNIIHDLVWLRECGFVYEGAVHDTMLTEYVLQRGEKEPLSLEACAERHDLPIKKQTVLKEYLNKGVSVDAIPHDILSEYLADDLGATDALYANQINRLQEDDNSGLVSTVKLTNDLVPVLTNVYCTGAQVDVTALEDVERQFRSELHQIETELASMIHDLMGDTPINLNSGDQLAQVIYSRRVTDKAAWGQTIHSRMPKDLFTKSVNVLTRTVYKTEMKQCPDCKGAGVYYPLKKDGTPAKKYNICKTCNKQGVVYTDTGEKAGLKFKVSSAKLTTDTGFATDGDTLQVLEAIAIDAGKEDAAKFLRLVRRKNQVAAYLSTFVGGIRNFLKSDGKLHVSLAQHRTATGRLAGRDPNMQNMPRGSTFPVKKVFISRWDGGEIMEADFAQLEFRAAAFLSQDELAMKEIEEGFDVHSYTSKVITDAGEPTTRQEAKSHTFAPLYGATGYGRTKSVEAYYRHFIQKYEGIALWHSKLAREALNTEKIVLPSGREYAFTGVTRRYDGSPTRFTNIKNYPVQGFATADIVPVVLIELFNRLKGLQSCVINTVHDSIVIDVHPDERDQVIKIIEETNKDMKRIVDTYFDIDFNVPLLLEAKIGPNWLEVKDV